MENDQKVDLKALKSVSLFYSNESQNSDKEYHIQLLEWPDVGHVVYSQYGKRGTKLVHTQPLGNPASFWAANRVYEDLLYEKQHKKGYQPISFDRLENIYKILCEERMDSAGVDLFINIRGKVIGLADYARQSGVSSNEQYPAICSYTAARAVGDVLAGVMGNVPGESEVKAIAHRVSSLLQISSSLRGNSSLSRVGIFLGRNHDGEIENLTSPTPPKCGMLFDGLSQPTRKSPRPR